MKTRAIAMGYSPARCAKKNNDDIAKYMKHEFYITDEDFIFGNVVRKAYLFDGFVLLVVTHNVFRKLKPHSGTRPAPLHMFPAAKHKTIGERDTGRTWEHHISRRGVAAQGYKESRQEDGRGDAQRAARRGGLRARRGRELREDGGPRGLPRRTLQEGACHD